MHHDTDGCCLEASFKSLIKVCKIVHKTNLDNNILFEILTLKL